MTDQPTPPNGGTDDVPARDVERDPELLAAFQSLRSEDRSRVPDAAAMVSRARTSAATDAGHSGTAAPSESTEDADVVPLRRRRTLRWGVPGLSVALAAAVATVMLMDREAATPDADFERVVEAWSSTGGAWRSPTDDLLRMPGDELLRTVPRIGGGSPLSPDPRAPRRDGVERESPS